jgi:hypothetical protein
MQRGPELVDQGGALGDEIHLIPAEQTQFLGDGVVRPQGSPGMTIGA